MLSTEQKMLIKTVPPALSATKHLLQSNRLHPRKSQVATQTMEKLWNFGKARITAARATTIQSPAYMQNQALNSPSTRYFSPAVPAFLTPPAVLQKSSTLYTS